MNVPVLCVIFISLHLQTLPLSVAHSPGSTTLNGTVPPIPAPVANARPVVTRPVHLASEITGSSLAESPLPPLIADTAVVLAPAVRAAVDRANGWI